MSEGREVRPNGSSRAEDPREVTALLLAGGLGTRLRDSVPDRPKVLAEVAGRPFLRWQLDWLREQGVRKVVLCTGHLGDMVESELADGVDGMEIAFSREWTQLGTAGALRNAAPLVTTDEVVVLNGDSFSDVDLREFLADARENRAACAFVTVRVSDASRFGCVRFDVDRVVTEFEEKRVLARPGWINAGIYYFATQLLRELSPRSPLSLENDVMPRWLGGALRAFPSTGRFIDIGTRESFAQAQAFFSGSPVPVERAGLLVLDRDGTVIEEKHYLSDPDAVELVPGAAEGLRALQQRGYGIAIVTNQSGIGRGYYDEAAMHAVNDRVVDLLSRAGVRVEGIWHCPHRPDDSCECRKPSPGMLESATRTLGYAASECVVVGDKACDIDLGRRAGAKTALVRTGYGKETEATNECEPDVVVDGIHELVDWEEVR